MGDGGHEHTGEGMSWRVDAGVLEVALHRAPCNELGSASLAELERLVPLLARPAGFGAVLLYSRLESGFCAGADLRELQTGLGTTARPEGPVRAFLDRVHAVFDAIDQAPVTTVAAVHRVVFGGGLELMLTCDVVVADPSTRLCLPEMRLGIVPGFGAIPRLRRDFPGPVVRDLLLTGRSLGAKRAYELGLVAHLSPAGKSLDHARSLARQAARFSPAAVAAAKSLAKPLPRAELDREKDLFCALVGRPDVAAALARFVADTSARPYLP